MNEKMSLYVLRTLIDLLRGAASKLRISLKDYQRLTYFYCERFQGVVKNGSYEDHV